MPERYEVAFEITRDEWIAANEALLSSSPYCRDVARAQRRAAYRQVLYLSPLVVVAVAVFIGRSNSTSGMYREGAMVGVAFVLLLLLGLPRLAAASKVKDECMKQIRRSDFSGVTGPSRVAIDERGVEIKMPARELKLPWSGVVVHDLAEHVQLCFGGTDGMFIPKRAFASQEAAEEFLARAREWWRLGQLTGAERIEGYLRDRDIACPGCGYNLRGCRAEVCPECGKRLTLEALYGAKQ